MEWRFGILSGFRLASSLGVFGSGCFLRGVSGGRRTARVSMVAASFQDLFEYGHYELREGVSRRWFCLVQFPMARGLVLIFLHFLSLCSGSKSAIYSSCYISAPLPHVIPIILSLLKLCWFDYIQVSPLSSLLCFLLVPTISHFRCITLTWYQSLGSLPWRFSTRICKN